MCRAKSPKGSVTAVVVVPGDCAGGDVDDNGDGMDVCRVVRLVDSVVLFGGSGEVIERFPRIV